MKKPPSTATELLEQLASEQPHKFPGAESDEENAKRYVDALALLARTCKPHYETAAQASLMKDIDALIGEIKATIDTNTDDDGMVIANELLSVLHNALYTKLRYLNGHGPAHIQIVDKRAFTLVSEVPVDLSPYEVFLLCSSLTIHDAGLVFGRDVHELSIHGILSDLGDKFATKRERDTIEDIASSHGGYVPGDEGNRATIDLLSSKQDLNGKVIRPQLIAAIVRLADELAEDYSRHAPIAGESRAQRKQRLKGSEAFHIYSSCLEPCLIDGNERVVRLQFIFDLDDVTNTCQIANSECFILDEVFSRTEKCFAEVLYCGRFVQESATSLPPNEVQVSIEIASDNVDFVPLKLRYAHKMRGYPDVAVAGLPSFRSELRTSLIEYALIRKIPKEDALVLLEKAPEGKAVARLLERLNPKPEGC